MLHLPRKEGPSVTLADFIVLFKAFCKLISLLGIPIGQEMSLDPLCFLQSDPKQILSSLTQLLGSLVVSPVPDTEEMLYASVCH